ncbi:DUF4097 family beta strand repeat-containing protein [Fodinibius sp. AD559]|uniref:DUF4097 family beta strand repeat-containing protein n=1 Tax=Fodinibius sp. AD559 TaxID=3424179 RepID=UPI004046FA56
MIKRNISWEIVIAGITFIGIAIYLLSNASSDPSSKASAPNSERSIRSVPTPPSPSNSIVIDFQNLETLKNLEKLRNINDLKNLNQLEFEIKNLDKLIQQYAQKDLHEESLKVELQQLERELQKINQSDFNVKLQDQKLYINRKYDIDKSHWTEVSSGVFVYQDSFSVDDLESLDFSVEFGNLNIVGNDSSSSKITLRATGDINDPAVIAQELSIQKNIDNTDAKFEVNPASGSSISEKINLEATLSVPQHLALIAKTSGGHITASQLQNTQKLNTSGGHITLSDIDGTTNAKTSSGHITANRVFGDITMSTGGGHIKIQETGGNLDVKTGGGHIDIQNAEGSISAKTSGGNISSTIKSAHDQLRFSTSAGNISLSLPKDIAADLDISGTSVNLDDGFNFNGTKNRGSITGTLNGGGLPIVINCGYGNVNISTND